jgi:hypothetical protein
MSRHGPRGIGDGEGRQFRPADDARGSGGCRRAADRVVPPLREPLGFAGCWECPEAAEMARRSRPDTATALDWSNRLV